MAYRRLVFFSLCLVLCIGCGKDDSQNNVEPKVYIAKTDSGYQLINNGKPFVIKGASGNSHYKELKDAGANTVRSYDTTHLKMYLDDAQSESLYVVIDLPIPRFNVYGDTLYNNKSYMDELTLRIENLVRKYKDHPAVLYWILGNEVYYPKLYSNDFAAGFNRILKRIHEVDPNHPVSTTVSSSGLKKVFGILTKSPELDFISVNNFGALTDFRFDKNILFFWNGPYVISEWGNNGPWESNNTAWNAPLEASSTNKAEQYKNHYVNNIKSLNDGRCLGSLVFFWGQKQERTHTWFSLFTEDGKKSQAVFELENLWKDKNTLFKGPQISSFTLDGKRAKDNITVEPNVQLKAQLTITSLEPTDSLKTHWEILPENWNYFPHEIEIKPDSIHGLKIRDEQNNLVFITPQYEGAYRLYVQVESGQGYFATANIPFYILNPLNEP